MDNDFLKVYDFSGRPAELLELFKDEPYAFLLETCRLDSSTGRFSFIGFDPFEIFRSNKNDDFASLKKRFSRYQDARWRNNFTPFACGLVGYLAYDFGLSWEKIPRVSKTPSMIPDILFGFYGMHFLRFCERKKKEKHKGLSVYCNSSDEKHGFIFGRRFSC